MESNLLDIVFIIFITIFNSILITYLGNFYNKYYRGRSLLRMSKSLVILNLVPILSSLVLLIGLFGNVWISFFITAILVYVLSLINHFKIYFREEPLLASDIKLLSESLNMAGEYSIKLNFEMIILMILIITYTIVLRIPNIEFNLIHRIIAITMSIVSIYFLSTNRYYCLDRYYEKSIDDFEEANWSISDSYQYHGFIYALLYTFNKINNTRISETEKSYASEVLNKFEDTKDVSNINFMVLMLESFTYFGEYGLDWNKYPHTNFDLILKNSRSGNLVTNVFGGGTVDTENAFLTGFTRKLSNKRSYDSLIKNLQYRNYLTVAMHPNNGWFYNRKDFYKGIGFDSFLDLESLGIHRENAQNDSAFIDVFLDKYNKLLEGDNPVFAFGITFQNHGPYSDEFNDKNEYISNVNKNANLNIFNNYISGIDKTDKELIKLFEFVERKSKPIVLILFGDHRPWLGFEGKGYEKLGIENSRNTVDGFLNFYKTPYIIYGNSAAKKELGKDFKGQEEKLISPNMLLPTVFNYMGFKSSSYGNYLKKVLDNVSVISNSYIGINNRFIKNDSRNERLLTELDIVERHCMNKGEKND